MELPNISCSSKNTDQAPSTAELLQASKSFYKQGKIAEQWFSSQKFTGTPLLISTKVARTYFIKQIDYALLEGKMLTLCEVKSSRKEGNLALSRAISPMERRKWLRTKAFLSNTLGIRVQVKVIVIKINDGIDFVKNQFLV